MGKALPLCVCIALVVATILIFLETFPISLNAQGFICHFSAKAPKCLGLIYPKQLYEGGNKPTAVKKAIAVSFCWSSP